MATSRGRWSSHKLVVHCDDTTGMCAMLCTDFEVRSALLLASCHEHRRVERRHRAPVNGVAGRLSERLLTILCARAYASRTILQASSPTLARAIHHISQGVVRTDDSQRARPFEADESTQWSRPVHSWSRVLTDRLTASSARHDAQ